MPSIMADTYAACSIADHNVFGPAVSLNCLGGFDFTLLFEELILTILPLTLSLLIVPFRTRNLSTASRKVDRSWLYWIKVAGYVLFAGLQLLLLATTATSDAAATRASLATAALLAFGYLVFAYLSHLEHLFSLRPSTLLGLSLGLTLILDMARVRTLWSLPGLGMVASVNSASIMVKGLLLLFEIVEKRHILLKEYQACSREATSGIYSRMLFLWVNGLLYEGFTKTLNVDALMSIDEEILRAAEPSPLQEEWDRADKTSRHALLWVMLKHHKGALLVTVPPKLILIALMYAQPFLIQRVLDFLNEPETSQTKNIAYGLIAAFGLVYIGIAVSSSTCEHKDVRFAHMLRGSLVSMISAKIMRLHTTQLADSSAITLMSADVDRICTGFGMFHEFWGGVVEFIVGMWLLARLLGFSALGPVLLTAATILLGIPLANAVGDAQERWLEVIEKRIAVTTDMLNSLKSIKMNGSVGPISNLITTMREKEISASGWYRFYVTLSVSLSCGSDALAPVLGLGTYILQSYFGESKTLTEGIAFSALVLMSQLTGPMFDFLYGMEEFSTVQTSFARIQDFLLKEEIDCSGSDDIAQPSSPSGRFAIANEVSAAWAEDMEPVIERLSVSISAQQINMVIGPVGCGKTTLLRTLLGEVPHIRGSLEINRQYCAYCAQSPWLSFGTIQDNILGINVWDRDWYVQVIEACALTQDLQELPDGDKTMIGPRGTKLSGGQQMRVSLARALYAKLSLVVLDDVFTGLDRSTEQTILQNLFGNGGLLKSSGSTVVLATNSAHQLAFADAVIVLNSDGQVADQGSFSDLASRNEYVMQVSSKPQVARPIDKHHFQLSEEALSNIRLPTDESLNDTSRRTGDTTVYWYYFRTTGWGLTSLFVIMNALYTASFTFPAIWVQLWTNANEIHGTHRVGFWLGIYSGLSISTVVTAMASTWVLMMAMCPVTARRFHQFLLNTTVRASTAHLTSTNAGQTINRFSQDLEAVDLNLPELLDSLVLHAMTCVSESILIFAGSSYIVVIIPLVLLSIYTIQAFYLRTSRQLRLLEIEAKAPLFSHFLETISGIVHVRAFGWSAAYHERCIAALNRSQKPHYLLSTIQNWLELVLELLVAMIAVALVAMALLMRSSVTSLFAVALFNVISFSGTLERLVTKWTRVEESIGAVSRIRSYVASVKPEDTTCEVDTVPAHWPTQGAIEFRNVFATYDTNLPPVLKGLTLSIPAGSKVALVGRTGSGKSSTVSTLLRMLDLTSGSIAIDNVDLSSISRDVLRERLNTLPQEPFFVHGSVRLNVDLQGLASDEEIQEALTAVGLWDFVLQKCRSKPGKAGDNASDSASTSSSDSLLTPQNEDDPLDRHLNHAALSHGQRQLFCLARALVKPSSIFILDEATSGVDAVTEETMQKLIRERFAGRTVLAIAHKLESIMDFDMVVVMDGGEAVEIGNPVELRMRTRSRFRALWGDSSDVEQQDNGE